MYPFVTFTRRIEARSLGARTFPFVADVVERVCASPWTNSRPQDSRRAQVLPQARCVTRAKRSASRCGGQLARSVGCEREPLKARGRRSREDEANEAKKGLNAWFGGGMGDLCPAKRKDELRSVRTRVRVLFRMTCHDVTKR